MNLVALIIQIILGLIISAPALWYVGKWRVGPKKAKFTDAIWISTAGTILNSVIGSYVGGTFGAILQLIAYLYLIKTYYETDWGNAFIISFVAVLLVFTVFTVLTVLGILIVT
jgi:hypothetical protein